MPSRSGGLMLAGLALGALLAAGCGGGDDEQAAPLAGTGLRGTIVVDGSSTVAPLTLEAGNAFFLREPGVVVQTGITGTGGGFERFCAGETDISDASRRITTDEHQACRRAGIEYEELQVAADGITVVTRADAQVGARCLTLAQLRKVWANGSKIDNWHQIDRRFADAPLSLAGPGRDSGTYDFFNERVLGVDAAGEVRASRQDYTDSEDDNVIVRAVEEEPSGMGYFGFSYYATNRGQLRAFALDDGGIEGCVDPSPDTITRKLYPLSRPLFIYVKKTSLQRPEVRAFVRFYLEHAVSLADLVDIVPAPRVALDVALTRVLTSGVE
jgi:phosphate transport system substrate-binding protein